MRRPNFLKKKDNPLDDLIAGVLTEMVTYGPNSKEYTGGLTYLKQLHELKAKERRPHVSRDTLVLVVGNLLGILLIVAYEQKHVMTSKGFNQILRPKTDQKN